MAAKDSLNSQDKIKRLLSITFEEREQAQQIAVEKANYQTKIRFVVLVVFLSVFVAIAFILFRNNRQKQKANTVLQGKNEEIEKTVAQLKTAQVTLAAKNAENELLLKEIHHRVKNNLEVVSSLLALQSAQIDDPDVQEAMQSSQNRVQSMGILHQKLYQSEQLAFIEMRQYFISLSENILDSYNETDRITVTCQMNEIELDVDTAVPLGLIVNELLTNALKYAFPRGQLGRVLLSLEDLGKGMLQLQISDNGIGKALNALPQGTGFGTQLVDLLIRQLDGTSQQQVENGTTISVQFKKTRLA